MIVGSLLLILVAVTLLILGLAAWVERSVDQFDRGQPAGRRRLVVGARQAAAVRAAAAGPHRASGSPSTSTPTGPRRVRRRRRVGVEPAFTAVRTHLSDAAVDDSTFTRPQSCAARWPRRRTGRRPPSRTASSARLGRPDDDPGDAGRPLGRLRPCEPVAGPAGSTSRRRPGSRQPAGRPNATHGPAGRMPPRRPGRAEVDRDTGRCGAAGCPPPAGDRMRRRGCTRTRRRPGGRRRRQLGARTPEDPADEPAPSGSSRPTPPGCPG